MNAIRRERDVCLFFQRWIRLLSIQCETNQHTGKLRAHTHIIYIDTKKNN